MSAQDLYGSWAVFTCSYLTLMCVVFGAVSLACPPDVAGANKARLKGVALLIVALASGLALFHLTTVIYTQ